MSYFGVLMALLATAFLSGCASGMPTVSVPPVSAETPYRLGAGDRLRVIVFEQNDLSNTFSVGSAGDISMPLIGRVRAQGLTTTELERSIEARLRQGYLRQPSVSVEVETYRPFFVLGDVAAAGQYPFITEMTVQKAIAVAGGFASGAVDGSTDITRIVDGRSITFPAPLTFPVRPGDVITVEEQARLFCAMGADASWRIW